MTSLDASHWPGAHDTADRTTGQAVYDSISSHLQTVGPSGTSRRDDDDSSSETDQSASVLQGLTGRQQQRRRRRTSSSAGSTGAPERIPVPPIPDLRYEQGVLASLQPFIHRVPASPATSTTAPSAHGVKGEETEKHELKVEAAETATLAARDLTAEAKGGSERQSDIFLGPLRIEWGRVVYVIVRDQVLSPLVQGVLWGVAGFYLSAIWQWNKARIAASRSGYPADRPSLLASLGIRTR
ncbi:hypothetical protein BMF94_5733 [Rhodotorula taiwanensis]|uniref:Uncharacterized protein n=1 Tax=Rhodotorula taiwanensis TaxID=741276 RepID=A0A2S5B3S2_9BASI|nr:hypothetical protein BMF94_5733 [Rhodotorula taiwanensis]